MTTFCQCFVAASASYTHTRCLRFKLVRERYLPYSELDITLPIKPNGVSTLPIRIRFHLNGQLLHDGFVRKAELVTENNERWLRIRSRSFTSVLTGNQLIPGMHYNVTLDSLMTTYDLPHITYQTGMEAINYVYVKENTAMWDAVTAYNYKLCSGFPYVRVPNLLCVTPQTGTDAISVPANALLAESSASDASELISRIDMANMDGEYGSFTLTNPEAAAREITKVRQISFDMQFIHNPMDALHFRVACSNRRLRQRIIRYLGYCGEDLEDLVQCNGTTARVSKITVTGDSSGVITEDAFYSDDFCNT